MHSESSGWHREARSVLSVSVLLPDLMAAHRVGRRVTKAGSSQSPGRDPALSLQRRQARVTVKYNRKELQRRLDVEKWIDCGLDQLYMGRVSSTLLLQY